MKYICILILMLTSWNSGGEVPFDCMDEQEGYEQLKREVHYIKMFSDPYMAGLYKVSLKGEQEYEPLTEQEAQKIQNYSKSYRASVYLALFYCQMTYGEDPVIALNTLQESIKLGEITAHFLLANYYLTGGWGQHPILKNRGWGIRALEETLQKMKNMRGGYPKTGNMALNEIIYQLYPQTVALLIWNYTDHYLEEGYDSFKNLLNFVHLDPAKANQQLKDRRYILKRLERLIENCRTDHEGENIIFRARNFAQQIDGFEILLDEYNTFYQTIQLKFCRQHEKLLDRMLIWESNLQQATIGCSDPPCANIQNETQEFTNYFFQDWEPEHLTITSRIESLEQA